MSDVVLNPVVVEEAEKAVLGSMILEAKAAVYARLDLDSTDFHIEKHRVMFDALCSMVEDQTPIDITLLHERLKVTGKLDDVGGLPAITDTVHAVSTTANHAHYCRVVKQASLQREFDLQLTATRENKTLEQVERLDDLMLRINGQGVGRIVSFQEDLSDIVEEMLEKPITGYQTGFFGLDALITRFEPGDLITLGARTSGGKTAMMVSMMMNMAQAGVSCLFLTTEMDDVQLIKRILPSFSGVEAYRFRAGNLSEDEKDSIRRATYQKLQQLPIKIMAKSRMSIKDIRGAMIKTGAQVVFFDYLQRAAMKKGESRVYEIEEFMVQLKTVARALERVVVTAVQLDRGLDKTPTVPPSLSDLRGSGAIESESDTVILLWRPPEIVTQKRINWIPPSPGCIAIEAVIPKNRHGPTGASDLELNGELVSIAERTLNRKEHDVKGGEWCDTKL